MFGIKKYHDHNFSFLWTQKYHFWQHSDPKISNLSPCMCMCWVPLRDLNPLSRLQSEHNMVSGMGPLRELRLKNDGYAPLKCATSVRSTTIGLEEVKAYRISCNSKFFSIHYQQFSLVFSIVNQKTKSWDTLSHCYAIAKVVFQHFRSLSNAQLNINNNEPDSFSVVYLFKPWLISWNHGLSLQTILFSLLSFLFILH